jgi:hypothetical protein
MKTCPFGMTGRTFRGGSLAHPLPELDEAAFNLVYVEQVALLEEHGYSGSRLKFPRRDPV